MQFSAGFTPGSCFYYNQLFYFWLKYLHLFSSLRCPNYVLSWIICERTRRTDNIRVSQVKVAPMRTHKFQSAAPFGGRGRLSTWFIQFRICGWLAVQWTRLQWLVTVKWYFFVFTLSPLTGSISIHPCFSLEIRNCALLQNFIKNKYSSFIKFTLL